jgi:RNA polymerase sigma-70 factor, ECF subfamily
MNMYPDEALLAGCDNEATALSPPAAEVPAVAVSFDEVFERYHRMVYQLVCRFLGDREEALDVTQEIFLTVHRKLDGFRGESSIKTWIYRIAINRASNRFRWWKRLRRRGTVSLDEHLNTERETCFSELLEYQGQSPEDALLRVEQRAEIERCLAHLPLEQRTAVILRDIEGFSYEEIAETTNASLGTVKSRIARGREDLKRRLNGRLSPAARSSRDL